ncbi:MAG TPA: hypothetical protein VGL59_15090 [Polyangia bacterium]|jgi:hypothetical protein
MRKPRPKPLRNVLKAPATTALLCLTLGCARVSGSGGSPPGVDASPASGARDAVAQDPPLGPGDATTPSSDAGAPAADGSIGPPGECPGGTSTSLTGTTYAPNGKLPLFNVAVYVPSTPLVPFAAGVSCDRCGGTTVHALAAAVSDEQGRFRITNVPAGKDVPLVFQVGKWRRKVILPNVVACQENAITDPNLTRLPRNRQEGDMPKIAITTGSCDMLGCLPSKIGVDTAEFGVAGDDKPVTYYQGAKNIPPGIPAGVTLIVPELGPPDMTPAETLWRNDSELGKYDLTLLSCECDEYTSNKGAAAYAAMASYLARGGRIFGTDYMYVWYRYSADSALAATLDISGGARQANSPMVIDTSFPKGKALADWMKFLDPGLTYGQITSDTVFSNLNSAMPATTQVWATSTSPGSTTLGPRIVSVNTPVNVPSDQQCGRAVHLDAHISPAPALRATVGADAGMPGFKFPQDCGTTLNKGEEALAFLFFDLAACVQKDTMPVVPPIIIP